jgi:hypothetical protein
MSYLTKGEIQPVLNEIKTKASLDNDFRNLCLKDINAAIEQTSGKKLPEDLKLDVVEASTSSDVTLVLPPVQPNELSEDNLDNVSGGAKCGTM